MIRPAVVSELEQVLELLKQFAQASLIDYQNWSQRDERNARVRLTRLIIYEYLMVAEVDGKLVGMIGAQREQDPWFTNRKRMRELFWWVTPEYRKSRISAELFVRWQQDSDRWLSQGIVNQVSLSLQPGVSDIRLNKRGWTQVESHWIKG